VETGVEAYLLRWSCLRVFAVVWLLLSLVFITILFPPHLILLGILGSILGTCIGGMAILKGRWRWAVISLLDGSVMLFVLLLTQAMSKTVGQNLPVTLLQFVMLLFATEVFAVIFKRLDLYAKETIQSLVGVPIAVLARSNEQAFRQVARFGLLFASFYLISIAALYLGTYLASITPVLADVSLFVVVVSISLALLVLMRED